MGTLRLLVSLPAGLLAAMLPIGTQGPSLSLAWPVPGSPDGPILIGYYPDQDASAGTIDYAGRSCTYNGHEGTDFVVRTFLDMDSGVAVLSSTNGLVESIRDTFPDRNAAWADSLYSRYNHVTVRHADGSKLEYLHLRRNSAVVVPGDSVHVGDTLGLIGSSGYSNYPHLHLGILFQNYYVDPWNGPRNNRKSLWASQSAHPGAAPSRIAAVGLHKLGLPGITLAALDHDTDKFGLTTARTVSTSTDTLVMWVRFQAKAGDSLIWTIRTPQGDVAYSYKEKLDGDRCGWRNWRWAAFPKGLGVPGTWRFVARVGGDTASAALVVGAKDSLPPRFFPIAGRSVKLGKTVRKDTLRILDCPGCTFELVAPPSGVSLDPAGIVSFPAAAGAERSRSFRVKARTTSGDSAEFFYQAVDPTAPYRAASSVKAPLSPRIRRNVGELHRPDGRTIGRMDGLHLLPAIGSDGAKIVPPRESH